MKKNELIKEFFLMMKKLANRDNIDDSSFIQYVIHGIADKISNKVV